ncbi:tRNA-splicing ligase RtcB [Candidatus Kuenenia stuttgartiensis]|uniref:tRNA-splicing ligase RtcB n=1 Tax=Kuenenia stuttgartiensis TaxID=174633 RepID=Q1PY19_KUEST|nr:MULTISPECIES: RtcB family protein [Kuenenia]MBE7546339.1 RtcB family protein [Planctomycetia bacterium]MBZ0192055.1 RtcB family protein [Candidatus Kuenenia stuttgartiensis]MCF6151172.1 RtcB family protein [Candidatus Kuenenia stuttgartiensis]MCL4725775.1 RtcB family protein [Candidatus Kuenenia stuttgartiensis]MCZ7623366.1 RtcB family protein [Candidatus Kuenenia sp.]
MNERNYKIQKIDDYRWRILREGKMHVDGIVYADESMMKEIQKDESLQQVINVACLPGIVGHSLGMPDIHWGYGFPIGGVAAFDMEDGVVSPGGVGYDINCGVRLLKTGLCRVEISGKLESIVDSLFVNIPSGVGSHRKDLKLSQHEVKNVLKNGAQWAVSHGYGSKEDLEHIEEKGCIFGADPELVSTRAIERGLAQLGTLGSGNHFVEVGYVSEIFDEKIARTLGLEKDGITIMIHTGSRGLGYQVCDDFIKVMIRASGKYNIELPDRQLCCAPINSPEGRDYFAAMACAANYAFANRQMITHWVRESFERALHVSPKESRISLVYDACHNIAKFEDHLVNGQKKRLCVHRKGATRAFPPNHPDTPAAYKAVGQPVFIPGDMGRCSYVLVGTEKAYSDTFGSTCHGAGRVMSRNQATKVAKGRSIAQELKEKGILVRADSRATLEEELSDAYKDVTKVVDVVQHAGISKKVAQLKPLCVIKG